MNRKFLSERPFICASFCCFQCVTFNSKIKSDENIQYFTSRIKTKFPYKRSEAALCLVFEGRFSVPRKTNIQRTYFLTKIKLRLSYFYRNLPINPGTFFRLTHIILKNNLKNMLDVVVKGCFIAYHHV